MAEIEIDFEGTGGNAATSTPDATTQTGSTTTTTTKEDVTDLTGDGVADINKTATTDDSTNDDATQQQTTDNATTPSTGELEAGTQIEFEDKTYTVAANGDLVDDKGNVFKKASEVNDWMDSLDQETDEPLSITAIQESLGTEITDEQGKSVEFTNDAAGVKAYVEAVISLRSNELQQGAVNKLYAENPLLKQFNDYVTLTGSYQGFGELPDRTGIEVDKESEAQQVAIIKMAAQEFGNKSLNDNYIKYLKDTGALYDEAVAQLEALQEKDKAVRADIAKRAEEARNKELEEFNAYWNRVNDVIKSRNIAGYKLPESFVKEVNGQKQTLTPNDFYNYLSRQTEVDADGKRITAYQRDLNDESDEDLLNRELISAWLMYTGGTYKDLIDMAIKEEQVRVLKLKSKERANHKTVKVVKPQGKTDLNDIVLS